MPKYIYLQLWERQVKTAFLGFHLYKTPNGLFHLYKTPNHLYKTPNALVQNAKSKKYI